MEKLYCQIVPAFSFLGTLNALAAADGLNLPKSKKNYNFHNGIAILQSGEELTGKFKCRNRPGEGYGDVLFYAESDSTKKIKLFHRDFKKITLEGAFPDIVYRKDSTELIYIEKYNELYREVIDGKIKLFNNCYNINEFYDNQQYFKCIAFNESTGFVQIKYPKDIAVLMVDQPYFLMANEVFYDISLNDYDLIHLFVQLYNSENPVELLNWDEMKVTLVDNTILNGFGLIQSVDLSDQNENEAYLHFYSDRIFRLLNTKEVLEVSTNNLNYKPIYDISSFHRFFATQWNYEDEVYYASSQSFGKSNLFHKIDTSTGNELVFFKTNKSGKFKQVKNNRNELVKSFVDYRNSVEKINDFLK